MTGTITILLLLFALTFTFYASPAYADAPKPCNPNDAVKIAQFGPCPGGLDQIEQVVGNVISVVVSLGFMAMLVLLIWAGIKYLTSGGEPKAIQAAHYTAGWALLGVFIMAVAWLTLQLVAGITGIDVTVFNIKTLCGLTGQFCQ